MKEIVRTMIDPDDEDRPVGDDLLAQAELAEAIARRLESGDPVTSGDLGDDPETAVTIRQLLPTLRAMVSLGEQVAREESSQSRLQKKREDS